jgi:hypothetical protein
MATHVRILGWLHLIYGLFGLLTAFAIMGGSMLGGMFTGSMTGMVGVSLVGTFAAIVVAALSIPGLIAGYGLLRLYPWARYLTIVLAVFELFRFPLGTILGAYSLWVLLSAEGSALFQQRSAATY